MLVERRKSVKDCSPATALKVADFLCHACPDVRRIFECVKIYTRIHESGSFTYARHPHDLGTGIITAESISSRMKDPARAKAVKEALHVVENDCFEHWPFTAGSSSWVLIEVLHPSIQLKAAANEPTIIFRKAARISPRGEQVSTPLLERVFSSMQLPETKAGWSLMIDPVIRLQSTSGTGIFTKLREQLEGVALLQEEKDSINLDGLSNIMDDTLCEFYDELLSKNFSCNTEKDPGFYFSFDDQVYQIRSRKYAPSKKIKKEKIAKPPLPVFGLIR